MSLLELQRSFHRYLVDAPNELPGSVSVQGRPGLGVYHNAYRAQLVAALKDSYERLWAWLGDESFEQAARAHVEAYPPHSWTLGDYGDAFSHTLSKLYPDDIEIAELATLDWALRRAFESAAAISGRRPMTCCLQANLMHFHGRSRNHIHAGRATGLKT